MGLAGVRQAGSWGQTAPKRVRKPAQPHSVLWAAWGLRLGDGGATGLPTRPGASAIIDIPDGDLAQLKLAAPRRWPPFLITRNCNYIPGA